MSSAEESPRSDPAQVRRTWVARTLVTGEILPRSSLVTYELTLGGESARLVIQRRRSAGGMSRKPTRWKDAPPVRARGTAARRGSRQEYRFVEIDLVLRCRRQRIAVAPATAVRIGDKTFSERTGEECGDPGVWSLPETVEVEALACAVDSPADQRERLVFAPAPGVEHVFVNNDCAMQGGGLRQIAADGALAPATKD